MGPTTQKPLRRVFTAEYKARVLKEADAVLAAGIANGIGDLLRREGLYSSHLTEWRRQRESGRLAALAAQKRGPKSTKNPLSDEVARLQRRVARLELELKKAETVIDVQKKVAALLGEILPTVADDEDQRRKQ